MAKQLGAGELNRDERTRIRRLAQWLVRPLYERELERLTHGAETALRAGESFNAWLARELRAAIAKR